MSLFRQRDLDLLIKRALACGLRVVALEITSDGVVRVVTSETDQAMRLNDNESWVDLAGEAQDHQRA